VPPVYLFSAATCPEAGEVRPRAADKSKSAPLEVLSARSLRELGVAGINSRAKLRLVERARGNEAKGHSRCKITLRVPPPRAEDTSRDDNS